jgi:hypothetical protein
MSKNYITWSILLVTIVFIAAYVLGLAEHFTILTQSAENQIISMENQYCHFLRNRLSQYGADELPLVFKDQRFIGTKYDPSACYLRLSDRIINNDGGCNSLKHWYYENDQWEWRYRWQAEYNWWTRRYEWQWRGYWHFIPRVVNNIKVDRVKDHLSSVTADVDACVVTFNPNAYTEKMYDYIRYVQSQDPGIRDLRNQIDSLTNQKNSYWQGWNSANYENSVLSRDNQNLRSENSSVRNQRDGLQNTVNWYSGNYNDINRKNEFARAVQPELSYVI